MKMTILVTILLLAATQVIAQNIKLVDPEVLGQPRGQAVKFFAATDSKGIDPQTIQVNLTEGKYSSLMVHYGADVTLEQAREALNKKYKKYQTPTFVENSQMGLWRVTDRKFAIQLTKVEEGIRIIYLPFTKADLAK